MGEKAIYMNNQKDSTSTFLHMLSDIKEQLFQQKRQAISLAEQMIQTKDSSYIPQILSCFPIREYLLSQLDVEMFRLSVICEIVAAEEKLPGSRLIFLEHVDTFGELMEKYVYVTFLLRRLEFPLSKDAKNETMAVLSGRGISVCAIRKITDTEIFNDTERVYTQALQVMGGFSKLVQ